MTVRKPVEPAKLGRIAIAGTDLLSELRGVAHERMVVDHDDLEAASSGYGETVECDLKHFINQSGCWPAFFRRIRR